MDVDSVHHRDHRRRVGRVDVFLKGFPSDGAIHGTGIDHDEAKTVGKFAGERAFSGGGGTIDGDGEAWIGCRVGTHAMARVGRVKSAACECP